MHPLLFVMRWLKIKAKFIGSKDKKDSYGFIYGKVYDIRSKVQSIGKSDPYICIYDNNSRNWCPYDSVESILNNWKFL